MPYQSRSAWTSRPNRSVKTRYKQQHLTWHYPGFGSDSIKTASWSHDRCLSQIDTWERQHQRRGSKNIEYNWFACAHGYLIEGRGDRQNGANGTSHSNRRGQSCQVLIGDNEPLTAGHRSAMRECVARVERNHKGSTGTQYGHQHWVGTRCPGPYVMAEIPVRPGLSIPIGGGAGVPQPSRPSVKPDPNRPWLTSPRVAAMSKAEVRSIQHVLAGFDLDLGSYGVDGSYGDDTGKAVQTLQRELHITPTDGIYGPGTEAAVMTIREDISTIKRSLEPGIKGKRVDGEFASFIRDQRNILRGDIAQSRAAIIKAVQETGKAQGLTDAQVAKIASAAAEAAANVSAEDVAGLLDITVKG